MSAQTTVRLSGECHEILKKMAQQSGVTMKVILERAITDYERRLFFDRLNAAYAVLRQHPEEWASWQAEREVWDSTAGDGIDAPVPDATTEIETPRQSGARS